MAPVAADVSTTDGPQKALVFGTVGGRTVVRWEAGPRAGRLGWVQPDAVAVALSPQRDVGDPRLRCTARPAPRG